MPEYIIGKEGTQRFPIKNSRVSRQHARLTITDDGKWILEDLNSTNGTYILNDNNELVQIKRLEISEFTKIVLADQTAMGYTFFAHHVIEEDPNDYRTEFRYVMQIHDAAIQEKQMLDKKSKNKKLIKYLPSILSSAIGLILTLLLPMEQKILAVSATAVVTALLTTYINMKADNNDELKHFSNKYLQKLTCPKCGKLLNESEFNNQMCAACKAHA